MEPIRERIEDFIRRYGHEGNRVLRVLAVAILLTVLLANRVLRGLRLLAVPVLIGAIVVVGAWLLPYWLTIPRVSTKGPVVRNGVAAVVACGKKQGIEGMGTAMKYAPESATGGWWDVQKGDCTLWYHRPPDPGQRFWRHHRAQRQQTSVDRNDGVWACCGRKVS